MFCLRSYSLWLLCTKEQIVTAVCWGWAVQVGAIKMGLVLTFQRTVGFKVAGTGIWKEPPFVAGAFGLGAGWEVFTFES